MKLLLLSLAAFTALYLLRFYTVRPTLQEEQRIRVTGQISEEPRVANGYQRIAIDQIRIYLDRFPEYYYGDRVVAEGEVARGKAGWFLRDPGVEKIETTGKFPVLRQKVLGLYGKYLPEPHSALLSGIVLGTKTSLDSQFFEALRKTGTLHIVVASGMNISLFAGGILSGLSYFTGRRRAIIPALFGVLFYVVLVGFQPPIVRAAVMGSIAFAAQAWGREFDAWRALFISGAVMLLVNPLWLFDVGFQLSFLATAGMIAWTSGISNRLALVPAGVRANLATTLAAQAAVSPILLFNFGQLSLISPLVNVLVLPTVALIMAGGMIVAGLGLVWEPWGQLAAWFVWLFLEYFVRVIQIFS